MVKSYLKYEFYGSAGVVASHASNLVGWPPHSAPASSTPVAPLILAPGLETVGCWNSATGALEGGYQPEEEVRRAEVTCLALNGPGTHLAVGHRNGGVAVCEVPSCAIVFTAVHHRGGRAVTALAWSATGALLASGSQDTAIIVWDTTAHEPAHHLKGHQGPVVGLHFLAEGFLLSAGGKEDCTLRLWDLRLGEVVHQVLTPAKDLSAIAVDPEGRRCICGGVGKDLYVYDLEGLPDGPFAEFGALQRHSGKETMVLSLRYHPRLGLLAVQGGDRVVEVWRVLSEKEAKAKLRRLAKRSEERVRKKRREKAGNTEPPAEDAPEAPPPPDASAWGAADDGGEQSADVTRSCRVELEFVHQLSAEHKLRSVDWVGDVLALGTTRNTIERWTVSGSSSKAPSRLSTIQGIGHRNHLRAACQSPDDLLLATLSEDTVLVWRLQTASLVCAFPDATEGYCLRFLPGSKHLVVGTKTGKLDIYSVTTAALVDSIRAHADAVLTFTLSPDSKGLLSGGRDKRVVFWNYALAADPETQTKHITLVESSSAEMEDVVLDVVYSPDGTKVALALQDNTMKVFYADTFKFALSLYGHKLPVNSMSISSDGQLLVSGSMDKNLKIWGMVFGECRKSIFAHDDSITSVAFCPGTHYFFSVSRDTTIKYWDADHYALVQIIRSHIEGITCLALNSDASMVVTAGHDRSVRAFFRSEEVIFANEQREEDLERAQDEETAERVDQAEGGKAAGHHSAATLKAGEMLSETLTFVLKVKAFQARQEQRGPAPGLQPQDDADEEPPTALLFGKSPEQYLITKLESIRAADLPHAIALLPFSQCLSLLTLLHAILAGPPPDVGPPPAIALELAAKVTLLITQQHKTYLIQHPHLVPVLQGLRTVLQERLSGQLDRLGFTTGGLMFLQRKMEDDMSAVFFDLSKRRFHKKAKDRRRREVEPAA